MVLSIDDIRKNVKERRKQSVINRAIYHQNRIRFHAQTALTPHVLQPTTDFLTYVQNLIPHDKYKVFETLFRYPVKTNEITHICFDKLSRIFEGRNPVFNYQFANNELREDWEAYRLNILNEPKVWSVKGWEHFQTEINSVLVVDLPQEQKTDTPEPYFYWLPIEDVIDFKANDTCMDYIIFRQGDKIVAIDDISYRVFEGKDKTLGALISESAHNLGYCPARFFWSEPISLDDKDVKRSPLTNELESLDWFLFYHLSKRQLDMYGSYPIYSGYEQSCDYSNQENGDYCDGGYLKNKQGFYKVDQAGVLMPCPKCGNKHIVGVGSFVEIPIPDGKEQPDLRNPIQMLSVDRNSLDYNVEEEKRLKNDIITAVVGTNEEITQRQALNEQQVQANFESQSTILNRIKKGFEEAQAFVDSTICRLRYGNAFINANINYGTVFYVYDANELRERYKTAKDNGASEAELDALQNQIVETEYRNDPTALRRMLVLAELEPFRHLTREEVVTLYDKGLITPEQLKLKLNFSSYIHRFERENLNVLKFGDNTDFNKKINIINSKLKEYAREEW